MEIWIISKWNFAFHVYAKAITYHETFEWIHGLRMDIKTLKSKDRDYMMT